jgi:hypothetical protein
MESLYVLQLHSENFTKISTLVKETKSNAHHTHSPGPRLRGNNKNPQRDLSWCEDEFHGSANDDVDEDMNSAGRDSDDVEGNVDEGATGRGDSDEGKEDEPEDLEDMEDGMSEHVHDKSVDQLNGDEEEDEELAGAYSEMEDERGVFNYRDFEEHIMEDNDEDDEEDDLEE